MRSRLAMPAIPAPGSDATIERTDPARPLTDAVRDTIGNGAIADVVQFLLEPALQLLAIVMLAVGASRLARRVVAHVVVQLDRRRRPERLSRGSRGRRAARADALVRF